MASFEEMSRKFRSAVNETEALEQEKGIEHPATARANGRAAAAGDPTRLSGGAPTRMIGPGHTSKEIRLAALAAGVSTERVDAILKLLEEK